MRQAGRVFKGKKLQGKKKRTLKDSQECWKEDAEAEGCRCEVYGRKIKFVLKVHSDIEFILKNCQKFTNDTHTQIA